MVVVPSKNLRLLRKFVVLSMCQSFNWSICDQIALLAANNTDERFRYECKLYSVLDYDIKSNKVHSVIHV